MFKQRQTSREAGTQSHGMILLLVPANEPKPKDLWDKAPVISAIVSVIFTLVVALFTYNIQRTQIRVSQEIAHAQNEIQRGQLIVQLVPHLTSESEAVRQTAIVALRQFVPEAYDGVAAILARSARVPETAIQQLGPLGDVAVAQALGKIATPASNTRLETE
jgi:hypothetical protein